MLRLNILHTHTSKLVTRVLDPKILDKILRQSPQPQKQVKTELSKLGLKVISLKDEALSNESKSSETASSFDSESLKKKKKEHKFKKHKKSGINAKSSDKVKDPQRWPHAYLQYVFVNKQVKFDFLSFLRMICMSQNGKVA